MMRIRPAPVEEPRQARALVADIRADGTCAARQPGQPGPRGASALQRPRAAGEIRAKAWHAPFKAQ
jgi:hypothetical protein